MIGNQRVILPKRFSYALEGEAPHWRPVGASWEKWWFRDDFISFMAELVGPRFRVSPELADTGDIYARLFHDIEKHPTIIRLYVATDDGAAYHGSVQFEVSGREQ